MDHRCPECGLSIDATRQAFAKQQQLVKAWFETAAVIITVVVAILIIGSIITPRSHPRHRPRLYTSEAQRKAAMIAIQVAVLMADDGLGPSAVTLDMLTTGQPPYLKPGDLIDPWGNRYVLVRNPSDASDWHVVSYGADGMPGGTGVNADIGN